MNWKGLGMTVLDSRRSDRLEDLVDFDGRMFGVRLPAGNGPAVLARPRPTRPGPVRPALAIQPARPRVAPLAYRGNGIAVSHAGRCSYRSVSTSVTVALAVLAGLITLWLGWIAHLSGGVEAGAAPVPDRLAVVRVQAGETLQQVASRMVPGVPVGQVVDRIRDLNNLDSAEVGAGQTLIAPVG